MTRGALGYSDIKNVWYPNKRAKEKGLKEIEYLLQNANTVDAVRQTPQNSRSIGSKSKVRIFIRGYIIIFFRELGQQNFLEKSKRLVRVPLTAQPHRNDSAN